MMNEKRLTDGHDEVNRCKVWFVGYHNCGHHHSQVQYNFDRPCLTIGCWLTVGNNGGDPKEQRRDGSDTEIPRNTDTGSQLCVIDGTIRLYR